MELEQPDPEVDALRELGRQQDNMEGRPIAEAQDDGANQPEPAPPAGPSPEAPQEGEEVETETVSSEPEPSQPDLRPAARERDERGRYTAPQLQGQQGEQPTEYQQAVDRQKKDAERFDRSWYKLQQEKEQLRQQEAIRENQWRMQQLQQQAQPVNYQKDGIDAAGYFKASEDFANGGDYENALRAYKVGLELYSATSNEMARRQEYARELGWRQDMERAIAYNPEIGDPNTRISQEVDRIVNQHPYLFYIPQGFLKAAEIATLLLRESTDSELREENERLLAEIEALRGESQPQGGGRTARPPSSPTFDDMSMEEQGSYLRQISEQEDLAMRR
jgi:hypothetical protein